MLYYSMPALAAGFILDLMIGDPRWLYHPVCLIGNLIAFLEKILRKIFPKTDKGELAAANIFEAHFPKISPAKVVVEYGKPIYPDELSKEDKRHVGEYTQNVIREMLIKNKPLTEN